MDIALLFMRDRTLYIHALSVEAYERAIRVFPLRTGVPNPEWIVVGREADKWGMGGVLGAGLVRSLTESLLRHVTDENPFMFPDSGTIKDGLVER